MKERLLLKYAVNLIDFTMIESDNSFENNDPSTSSIHIEHQVQDDNDFEPPKRRRSSSKSKNDSLLEADDEAECCPICFERWENSGSHRLASLKCGHLFGQSCLEKWLQGKGGKCPKCNSKATKKDIRVIYAKTLRVCSCNY